MRDIHLVNAVIRGAHEAGWCVRQIGRSADRFDLLLAPVARKPPAPRQALSNAQHAGR